MAKAPLSISNIKTITPDFTPIARNVLVAPVLPEPYSRRFLWKNIFPIHKPKGMEPIKYANNSSNSSLISSITPWQILITY